MDHDLKYSRKYSKSAKGKINRRKHQLKKYGLTEKSYSDLYKRQNGTCAICKAALSYESRNTCIDHDHQTRKVRGILCKHCNLGLGFFQDDPNFFVAAMGYLQYGNNIYSEGDLLVISWYDIVENSEWKSITSIKLQSLPECKSTGWFLYETEKQICILTSINGTEDSGMEAGYILIPKAVIRNIETVRQDELDTE